MFSDELLKTLAEDGGQSNGPPVIQACDFIFLRYGQDGGFFEACGNHRQREGQIENICKNPKSWKAHALSTRPGIPSGPTALRMFTRLKDRVTSATESVSGLTSSAAAV